MAAALVAAVACSSGGDLDDGGAAPPPSTVPSTAPLTTPPLVTATPTVTAPKPKVAKIGGVTVGKYANDPAVLAYVDYLTARFEAFRRRDTRYAPLLRLSTPNRQSFDRERIERMIRDDETYEGKVRFAIVAAATTGTRARLRACERDDASWFVKGGRRSPTKPQWLPLDVRMLRVNGVWKVDDTLNANFSCGEAR